MSGSANYQEWPDAFLQSSGFWRDLDFSSLVRSDKSPGVDSH
jgi:hypothetical protein